jgi:hypothetical protein
VGQQSMFQSFWYVDGGGKHLELGRKPANVKKASDTGIDETTLDFV